MLFPTAHLVAPMNDGPLNEVWRYLRRVYEVVANIRRGKLECVTSVTLTASVTSTTLTDARISPQTVILLQPTTANAAAALATTYIVAGIGAATITHANNAQTDRSFAVALIG